MVVAIVILYIYLPPRVEELYIKIKGNDQILKTKYLNCFLYDMLVYAQKYQVKGNLMTTKPP